MSHNCKICGEYKSNEKFSGKGHAQHICKECAKLPQEEKNERLAMNRLISLPFRLSREQRKWLEKMLKDKRDNVRSTAEWAYKARFVRSAEPDEEQNDKWDDANIDLGKIVDIDPDKLPF